MAVIPGDELCGSVAARQIFPRDAETPVGLGAAGKHHGLIVGAQLLHRYVAPDAHVGKQVEMGQARDDLIDQDRLLELWVVRRDTVTH
jgi:hypothetical protein